MNAPRPPIPKMGLARAMANEVTEHLARLADGGERQSLDLRSLPMDPSDREELVTILGRGEVTATVEGAGRTDIHETRYPGVWWLRHHDMHGTLQIEEIQIAAVPEILEADPTDMRDAAARLATDLAALDEKETDND